MSGSPKISVIVPVYNTEPYLRECLDSILSQTISELEIIVINDGSPDRSIEIIREYEKKDARIVVIDKENEGVGKARNDGIQAASGEYVAFMDSDDYYPDTFVLQKLYDVAKTTGVKAAGGMILRRNGNGELQVTEGEPGYGLEFVADRLTAYTDYQYDFGYTAFIYDRDLLIANQVVFPQYGRFQDPPFFVRAMAAAGQFYRISEPVYVYREVSSPIKYSAKKTLDTMQGLQDNLVFSRREGLAKLHALTAHRLDHEVSFMITKNLEDVCADELIAAYLQTLAQIDTDWLKAEGYPLPEPFVPELFGYLRDATVKYERLRKNRVLKIIAKLKRR